MKRGLKRFPGFVWVLLGLLGIAAALLSLGQQDTRSFPSATSYAPSGTAALAELLKQNGYDVRVNRNTSLRLGPKDVAVGLEVVQPPSPLAAEEEAPAFQTELIEQVKQGGRAVLLSLPPDFGRESRSLISAKPTDVVVRGRDKGIKVSLTPAFAAKPLTIEDAPNVGLWDAGDESLARAYQVGKGRLIHVRSGSFATNRFLDQAANSRAAVELIGLLARPGDRIVFLEAAFGNAVAPSLVETIGPWANAAWQQFLLLGLVVVYTLGKRFGIPEEARPPQRGARELLEALTDTYSRGRQTRAAMAAALDRANTEIKSALRLPRDATRPERDRHLPPPLASALARLQAATELQEDTSPTQALELITKALTLTDEFLGGRRSSLKRRL